ncbi:TPA: FtsX-like permease family protein [Candidatus Poribacteria bacterium]|jgi:putative ABC transport system permease protein|nr:FtsX-like permease family protein [Candidatus Poribacteria bacterium]HIN30233.1 FtsX-like permease family protein [Candidatus Poribacteria bacterium]
MRISEGILAGIAAILANKLRTALTMLGIIIGVGSVLAMISIGDGAKAIVMEEANRFGGADQFSLYRSNHIRKGGRWIRNRSKEYFTYADVLAIEAEAPSVETVVPRIPVWGGSTIQGEDGNEIRAGYHGITPTLQTSMDWDLHSGRFITDDDVQNKARVCVVGFKLIDELFMGQDPIGKEIKIIHGTGYRPGRRSSEENTRRAERLTVVGVMTPRGSSIRYGWDMDNHVFMPLSTMQDRFTGDDRVTMLSVQAKNVDLVYQAAEEVKTVMRRYHNGEDEFFRTRFTVESVDTLDRISKVLQITLSVIAFVSLAVGGIGIMNMMLVSVNERTREIGLRKAIGAKQGDILFQFLAESTAMCSIGGALGVFLGLGLGYFASKLASRLVTIVDQWPFVFAIEWVVISLAFSAAIGIGFGLYPAFRAASLQPVEALRIE